MRKMGIWAIVFGLMGWGGANAGNGVDVRIRVQPQVAVKAVQWCEPIRISFILENASKEGLGMGWLHCMDGTFLHVNGQRWALVDLRQQMSIDLQGSGDPEEMIPGCGHVDVLMPLPSGGRRTTVVSVDVLWELYGRRPGRYEVWVEVDTKTWNGQVVQARSNVLTLVIQDVDAAEQAACRLFRSGRTEQLLRDYPTSRYAAWVVVQQLGIVGFWKGVGKTRQAIARDARRRAAGCYRWYRYHTGRGDAPHWEAVYFPDTAWTRTSVRWLERILALHGDFPYREEVQASLAMRLLALGHLQRGIGLLRDLAQHARQQRMRRWAGVFLATWQQWMGQ